MNNAISSPKARRLLQNPSRAKSHARRLSRGMRSCPRRAPLNRGKLCKNPLQLEIKLLPLPRARPGKYFSLSTSLTLFLIEQRIVSRSEIGRGSPQGLGDSPRSAEGRLPRGGNEVIVRINLSPKSSWPGRLAQGREPDLRAAHCPPVTLRLRHSAARIRAGFLLRRAAGI